MTSFKPGDVIKISFPYTAKATRQSRPALVVSTAEMESAHGLLWVVMITSAENRGWPEDVPITDLDAAGLPAASVIRPVKIATLEAVDAVRLGEVSPAILRKVTVTIIKVIAL